MPTGERQNPSICDSPKVVQRLPSGKGFLSDIVEALTRQSSNERKTHKKTGHLPSEFAAKDMDLNNSTESEVKPYNLDTPTFDNHSSFEAAFEDLSKPVCVPEARHTKRICAENHQTPDREEPITSKPTSTDCDDDISRSSLINMLRHVLEDAGEIGLSYKDVIAKTLTSEKSRTDGETREMFKECLRRVSNYDNTSNLFFSKSMPAQGHRSKRKPLVIDLTVDEKVDEDVAELQDLAKEVEPATAANVPHKELSVTNLADNFSNIDKYNVSPETLAEARYAFGEKGYDLPGNVKTWAELKAFVREHHNAGITMQMCCLAQTRDGRPRIENLKTTEPQHTKTESRSPELRLDHVRQVIEPSKIHQNLQHTLKEEEEVLHVSASTDNEALDLVKGDESSDEQPENILRHLDLCPELLPLDVPNDCPHLIQVWDEALLSLPLDRNEHLKLPDVIVSILYHYDSSTKETLKAFLDRDHVNHFFFLFKSRTDEKHSWSVEREEQLVTIGIERSFRGNTISVKPSTGQFDLYGSFILQPVVTIISTPPTNAAETQPVTVPVQKWLPHPRRGFTVPRSPTPYRFLFHTPPNRGADTRDTFYPHHNPVPQENLSLLARYLQQTSMRSTVMEAEIQVAWGRKVRYDAVLGRVRSVWDYALKSAETQRLKRQRGDYDRGHKVKLAKTEQDKSDDDTGAETAMPSVDRSTSSRRTRVGEALDF